ncbi:unnamed protein product [Diplocarpon coronariae]
MWDEGITSSQQRAGNTKATKAPGKPRSYAKTPSRFVGCPGRPKLTGVPARPIWLAMLALISATPSPFARKNRIALIEKGIPFKLQTEVPWHSTTETPKYKPPLLIPERLDDKLLVRQIQVLADGACDTMGLVFFETMKGGTKSEEWLSRRYRKVNGALAAADGLVRTSGEGRFLVCDEFSVADIARGSILGMMKYVLGKHISTALKFLTLFQNALGEALNDSARPLQYGRDADMKEARKNFEVTQPEIFELTEKVT